MKAWTFLRYRHSEDRFFFKSCYLGFFSVELRETTVAISVSTGEPVLMESEAVRAVSFSTMKLSKITR